MTKPDPNDRKIKEMTGVIMTAVAETGDSENMLVLLASLGTVLGCVAAASKNAEAALSVVTTIARGIISGQLVD